MKMIRSYCEMQKAMVEWKENKRDKRRQPFLPGSWRRLDCLSEAGWSLFLYRLVLTGVYIDKMGFQPGLIGEFAKMV